DKQHWQIDALEKKTGVNTPLTNGATNLSAGVNENTRKIEAEEKARKEAVNDLKKADQKLQDNIKAEEDYRIAGDNALNSRINQVESDATKGIAKASALAALHPLDYDPDNKFDIAAAGGFYKGENAFALGAFYRPNRNVMLSMGTTLTSGDNAYNVGLTFKIGKSGKHTEAGLTTADLYAMIGAMQDKMDQQQKKIEELEAKQAK
uniref:YadA C-terminal domain-containing protein n=1 Tax=Dialister sp. TaxID=1955814 RepID=UPI0040295EAF